MMHASQKSISVPGDRLATIWAIVEARKTLPVLLLVAGATAADDTTSIARGLAVAAGHAGQRTGYHRLNADRVESAATRGYSELSIPARGSRRGAFDAALADWRLAYDVLILDVSDVASDSLAGHAARIADGVIVGICAGRPVVAADRELAALLRALGAAVFGAVYCGPADEAPAPRKAAKLARREPALRA